MSLQFKELQHHWETTTIPLTEHNSQFVYVLHGESDITYEFQTTQENTQTSISVLCLATNIWALRCSINAHLLHSNCSASIHIVTLYSDQSNAHIDWWVIIHPDIIKAEWHLLEENIIIGEKVTLKTLPMLDVRSNDVKASHWARIERLDPQKLFYLQSKWLPNTVSKKLMITWYIKNILEPVENTQDISSLTERYLDILWIENA